MDPVIVLEAQYKTMYAERLEFVSVSILSVSETY